MVEIPVTIQVNDTVERRQHCQFDRIQRRKLTEFQKMPLLISQIHSILLNILRSCNLTSRCHALK